MKKSYIFAATAIFFWSTVAAVCKLLLEALDNFQLLWASSFLAAMFLLIVNIYSGDIKKLSGYTAKDYIVSILTGIPGTFFYYVFYYAGTDILPASQAFIINYLWPIMSVVFACIILKEKVTVRKCLAIAISFVGVGIVTGGSLSGFNVNTIKGAVFCVAGAVSYGIFTSLNQKYNYDKKISIMLSYSVTFVLTTVINGIGGKLFVPDTVQLLGFAWNGIFTMAIANTAWTMALESGNTAKISNLAYITPFLSLVWTFLVLEEPLNIYSVVGLIVIVSGIFIQLADKRVLKKTD